VLIADDEPPARAKLRRLLADEADVEIVGEASDGEEAVALIAEHRPDLVLLDVQMPRLDGFGVVAEVGAERMPAVVFVTAYDAHAVRAFEVHAVDYLLKPVAPERFRTAMARVRAAATDARDAMAGRLDAVLAALERRPAYLRRLLVHDERRALFLSTDEIDRIHAERNYVRLVAGGRSFELRGTLGALAARLDPARFLRISRGDVVRLDAVRELHPWSHGDYKVLMKDGTELTWSRRYRAQADVALEPPDGEG
jgi:two-component system LytT family response regulator